MTTSHPGHPETAGSTPNVSDSSDSGPSASDAMASSDGSQGQELLDAYVDHEPETEGVHDESVTDDADARPDYERVIERIESLGTDELSTRLKAAEDDLMDVGLTINSEDGNRPYPLDIVPRIISATRWQQVSAGAEQRVRAIELFLRDVYGPGEIIKSGRIDAGVLKLAPGYSEHGKRIPRGFVRAGVCGLDLVSPASGKWVVLEDNLRMPGGLGIAQMNRVMLAKHFAEIMPPEHTLLDPREANALLGEHLRGCASVVADAGDADELGVCMVTPGETDSTWFEQQLVSEKIGAALVKTEALAVDDGKLWRVSDSLVAGAPSTAQGRQRVHVLNPRMSETDLFESPDANGRPLGESLLDVIAAGAVSILNAPGNGLGDDKAIYALVPDMIDYYLGEKPILDQVPTLLFHNETQREEVLDRLAELVVKPIDGYGGADITIGPECSPEELDARRKEIRENPERFIAQDIVPLSTLPRLVDGEFVPSHVDLRAFVLQRPDENDSSQTVATTLPLALTRVAPVDTMVVNVSAGGGGKDTWLER